MAGINENDFSFKCPMNWDEMESSANGRFCGRCRKEVFDLTHCSVDEVIALQRKHGSICGSIRVMRTAAVAVSLSAAACGSNTVPEQKEPLPVARDQAVASQRLSGTPLSPKKLEARRVVMGKVQAPQPEE